MTSPLSPTAMATLGMASIAALLLLHHLLFRPRPNGATRVRLLLGLGVFPAGAAALYTSEALHWTTTREFCGSCHVMTSHLEDSRDPKSPSLAARHGRNAFTGESSCYTCHADYEGAMGYPLTKLRGMEHVYMYYFGGYRQMPLEKALHTITLAKPYPNSNCVQCHSGRLESFRAVREHAALSGELRTNTVACASAGCHGASHPFGQPRADAQVSR